MIALALLAGSSLFAQAHFYVGARIGYPQRAPVAACAAQPAPIVPYYYAPRPDPGYTWVNGYWYPQGRHYEWRAGYWRRPEYVREYWGRPRYSNSRYYRGSWRR